MASSRQKRRVKSQKPGRGKKPSTDSKPIPPTPAAQHIRIAYQNVAEACGPDLLQCCRECGEPEVIDRDVLHDYLGIHGGTHGKEVSEWVMAYPDLDDLNKFLDDLGVPRTWV